MGKLKLQYRCRSSCLTSLFIASVDRGSAGFLKFAFILKYNLVILRTSYSTGDWSGMWL